MNNETRDQKAESSSMVEISMILKN